MKLGLSESSLLFPGFFNFLLPTVKKRRVSYGVGLEASRLSGPLCFRFQCVFRVLPQCLRPETPLPSVLLTIELLSLLVDHEKLAPQLCSHSGKAGQGAGGTHPDSPGWLRGRRWQGRARHLLRAPPACAAGGGWEGRA